MENMDCFLLHFNLKPCDNIKGLSIIMKELRKYFKHYTEIYPNLSSFMCFGKACKHVKPTRRQIQDGFRELVEKSDYSRSDYDLLISHLENMAQ